MSTYEGYGEAEPVQTIISGQSTRPEVTDLADYEFAPTCDTLSCKDRGVRATWVGWSSHGIRQCPAQAYSCDPCREMLIREWSMAVNSGDTCGRCGGTPTGQLSDNLRFIKL